MTLLLPIGASHRLTEPSLSVLLMLGLLSLTAPSEELEPLPSGDELLIQGATVPIGTQVGLTEGGGGLRDY